jgi:hypothetical protein
MPPTEETPTPRTAENILHEAARAILHQALQMHRDVEFVEAAIRSRVQELLHDPAFVQGLEQSMKECVAFQVLHASNTVQRLQAEFCSTSTMPISRAAPLIHREEVRQSPTVSLNDMPREQLLNVSIYTNLT